MEITQLISFLTYCLHPFSQQLCSLSCIYRFFRQTSQQLDSFEPLSFSSTLWALAKLKVLCHYAFIDYPLEQQQPTAP